MTDLLTTPTIPVPPTAAEDDAEQIARARRLFELQRESRWRIARTDARERIARLRGLRTAILAHRQALYDGVRADFRKSGPEFEVTEMQIVLGEIGHAIRHLRGWMRPRRVPTPALLTGTTGRVRFEPRGQVLILGPWNYPFQLFFGPLAAAVAAGNTVIVRPSEKVPATAAVMARIVAAAFPEDEVGVVRKNGASADRVGSFLRRACEPVADDMDLPIGEADRRVLQCTLRGPAELPDRQAPFAHGELHGPRLRHVVEDAVPVVADFLHRPMASGAFPEPVGDSQADPWQRRQNRWAGRR